MAGRVRDEIGTLNRLIGRHQRSEPDDRKLAEACRKVLSGYRRAAAAGPVKQALMKAASRAFLHLGGDPNRATASLGSYDHSRYGPFLGVSDDGDAAAGIRDAGLASPKARALGRKRLSPLEVGIAIDAERLGGIGEVVVGPGEWAKVWLEAVDRVLVTTNIGTRVNMRVYRRAPMVSMERTDASAIEKAMREIAEAFRPFVKTPDGVPRPLIVYVEIPGWVRASKAARASALRTLAEFVASGSAFGLRRAPEGHQLGYAAWVRLGLAGKAQAEEAIELASAAGVRVVMLDGVTRKEAEKAISFAGLLNYFAPGIVGPLLRRAKAAGVQLRAANLPDPDTIARGVWASLNTARCMGAQLGKYGCFPLTLTETKRVVGQVQKWTEGWTAAPVFFVDQGLVTEQSVDIASDLMRGLKEWLTTVAKCGSTVVLIDTVDKPSGRRLLKKDAKDKNGYLGAKQIRDLDAIGRRLGLKILWAGGLGLRDSFELGRIGVFGIYVTSAAAISVAAGGTYGEDPGLSAVKRVQRTLVLRTKTLLEAGFLAGRLPVKRGAEIAAAAEQLLAACDERLEDLEELTQALGDQCLAGWKAHWKRLR
jgi:hypothetical protein